ncbi:MAG: M20/M25/M40 family metallo-hydrolase [Woeseiaceae bacterium]|nr:M20/M25/M40 family metallo-hydrolase [Woeseiaceae bacterium]
MPRIRPASLPALLAAALAACSPPAGTPPPAAELPAIDGAAIEAHVRLLADDLYEGREAGKRGYELAAKYVATEFRTLGLVPGAGDSYFQPVRFRSANIVPGSRGMTVRSANGEREYETFTEYTSSARLSGDVVSITAPLVFVGYGVNVPEIERNDYEGLDLEGKIAIVVTGAPKALDTETRAFYRSGRYHKSIELENRGAIGVISLQHKQISSEGAAVRGSKSDKYWLIDEHDAPQFAFEGLRSSTFLLEAGARKLFAEAPMTFDEMATSIEDETYTPMELGISATLEHRVTQWDVASDNVVAVLEGTDPALSDEYVLLSAHLDGVGMGDEPDDNIYNGYYDNASGIGTMLEVARALAAAKPGPRRSILFLATTGEEKGLLGAEHFAANPTVPVEKIVANVNMDMVMFLWRAEDVVGFGVQHSTLEPVLAEAAEAAGLALSPDPFPERGYFTRSDQFPFVRKGIPAVFLATGFRTAEPGVDPEALYKDFMDNHYHGASDDASLRFDTHSARSVALVDYLMTMAIANADERPTWRPDDFFGTRYGTEWTLPRP